jgi:hypothetical protein
MRTEYLFNMLVCKLRFEKDPDRQDETILNFVSVAQDSLAGRCERSNERTIFINAREFLDHLTGIRLIRSIIAHVLNHNVV